MRKFLKFIFILITLLVILVVGGGFLAAKLLNPNHYKDKIAAIVHEKTGRDLMIKGNIEFSFFPWVGVRVHQMQLSNAPGFVPQDRFIRVGAADISVKLIPLLSHQIEVGKITLRDVDLNLAKNKVGVSNWQDLTAAKTGHEAQHSAEKAKPEAAFLISIAGIDVENANVSWIDAQKGQAMTITNLQASSHNPGEDHVFPFSLAFDVVSNKPNLSGHFSFKSEIKFDHSQATYQLFDPQFSFAPKSAGRTLTVQAATISADLKQQMATLTNMDMTSGDLNVKSPRLDAQHILTQPVLQGRLAIAPFNLKKFLASMGKEMTTTDAHALEKVSVNATMSATTTALRLNPLVVHLDDSTLQGSLSITDFTTPTTRFAVNIDQSDIDIAQLVTSGKLVGRANLNAHLTFQGQDKTAMMRSLNGTVQFSIKNGAYVGKDIPYEVERAVALFKKQAPPPAPAKQQTDFDIFQGSGKLTNGLLSNNDLLVQSAKFKATGNGTANLVTEALNYHLLVSGLHIVTNTQGQQVQEERQTKLPVTISGTFSNPMVTPDLAALVKTEVGQKAIEKVTHQLKLDDKLGPGAGKAIGGALQQLLNR